MGAIIESNTDHLARTLYRGKQLHLRQGVSHPVLPVFLGKRQRHLRLAAHLV